MDQQDQIRVSKLARGTSVLGPGLRSVIWVQGCCFQCPGCLAQTYREGPYESYTPERLAQWYLAGSGTQGLTISGGEPMLQAGALARTIGLIRQQRDTGVIVYTGFTLEDLEQKARQDPELRKFLSCIDLLIDGPYVQELDDAKPYRGSSNQRIIPLTERYREEISGYYQAVSSRQIEITLSDKGTVMIGVPDHDQLAIWQKIKALGET